MVVKPAVRKIALLLCLCLVMFTGVPVTFTQAQSSSSSTAPYFYYFSQDHNAFIIERADGTDSRVFGAGLMQANRNHVGGAGWSPSGDWFAWTGGYVEKWSREGNQPFLMKADGIAPSTLLDEFTDTQMVWSPVDDVLLVAGVVGEVETNEETQYHTFSFRAILLDVPSQTILASFEETRQFPVGNFGPFPDLYVQWDDEGNYGFASFGKILSQETLEMEYNILRLDRTGGSHTTLLNGVYPLDSGRGFVGQVNNFSPNGWIAYTTVEDPALVIENLISGDNRRFDMDGQVVSGLVWDPTDRLAIAFIAEEAEGSQPQLALIDLAAGELTIVDESIASSNFSDMVYASEFWSPDGRRVLYIDALNTPALLDTQTGTISAVPIELVTTGYPELQWTWQSPERAAIADTYPGSYEDDGLRPFYTLAIENDEVRVSGSYQVKSYYAAPQITTDHRQIGHIFESATVVNTVDNTAHIYAPDSRRLMSFYGGEVEWHPEGDWLLLFEESLAAGGGYQRFTGVARADGSFRRELGYCVNPNPICMGWLPSQVDPASLAPGIDRTLLFPRTSFHTTGWVSYLAWSPDQLQIAARTSIQLSAEGQMLVWDLASGNSTTTEQITYEDGINWIAEEGGGYSYAIVALHYSEALTISAAGRTLRLDGYSVTDTETGEVVFSIDENGIGWMETASLSPDGRWLATGGRFLKTEIRDTQTWGVILTLPIASLAVAFSPDGKTLAVGSSWDVQFYDVETLLAGQD